MLSLQEVSSWNSPPLRYYSGIKYINKKAEFAEGIILRQLGHLDLSRPAAFRPHLSMDLALSGLIKLNHSAKASSISRICNYTLCCIVVCYEMEKEKSLTSDEIKPNCVLAEMSRVL
jgi:hypothetical protein